jgi:hypothetical protein
MNGRLQYLVHVEDEYALHYYKVDFVSHRFYVYGVDMRQWVEMPFNSDVAHLYFSAR